MRLPASSASDESDAASLVLGGKSRLTRQRREVYEVLLGQRDHPTATEVFLRVKERVPTISLATVYNCLETLSGAGFIKQVNLDRAPSRYCPNLDDHGHFHCTACGAITDIEFKENGTLQSHFRLPRGAVVSHLDVAIKGVCPACVAASKKKPASRAAQSMPNG